MADTASHPAPSAPPSAPPSTPPSTEDRSALDDAWARLGDMDPTAARDAVATLPPAVASSVEGLRLRGRAAWREGLVEAAMTLLADAIVVAEAKGPNSATDHAAALTDLAVMHMQMGRKQDTLPRRLLTMALALDPKQPEALAALASLAEDDGDPGTALTHLRAACAAAEALPGR